MKEQIPGRISTEENKCVLSRTGYLNTNTTHMVNCLISLKVETAMSHENLLRLKSILNEEWNF